MLETSSWQTILSYFNEALLWVALITSLCILIPQTIRLHKNKYADNSSIWVYIFYCFCNLIWVIYQTIYIVLQYNNSDSGENTKFLKIMLWTQLIGDILSFSIGLYTTIVKAYYMKSKKHKKNDEIKKIITYRKQAKTFMISQKEENIKNFQLIAKYYPEMCKKILKLKNDESIDSKIASLSTVEICVKIVTILNYFLYKQKNNKYTLNNDLYHTLYVNALSLINRISKKYPSVIYDSIHYHLSKKEKETLNKKSLINKTKESIKEENCNYKFKLFMNKAGIVSLWSTLAEIYQNFYNL